MYLELLSRFVAGGSLIVIVTLLSKTRFPALAGVFMLFPAVTLVGYYFVGQSMSVPQLQHITKFSILALSTTFAFLVAFYYARELTSLNMSLALATTAWLVSAVLLIGAIKTCQ